MNDFESAVASGLGDLPGGTVLLAAVSGGADSTAMLAALAALQGRGDWRLRCIHVEHGIRPAPESRGDARAVREFCRSLDIPCRVVSIAPGRVAETAKKRGLGIEGAARLFRHAAWNREALRIGAASVLVAHTRDDLLETLLMRILRGSGPRGLAGMPRRSGLVLRPLLDLSRADVFRYLARRQIPYRVDSTNADPAYLRNRIRLRLIPLLDECFPHWRRSLMGLAETQALTADFLEAEAVRRIPWQPAGADVLWSPVLTVSRALFFAQPGIIREEALLLAADQLPGEQRGGDAPDGPHKMPGGPRRRSVRLFAGGNFRAMDLGPVRIGTEGDLLALSLPGKGRGERGFSLLIKAPGRYTLEGLTIEAGIPESGETRGGAGFFAAFPLVLRSSFRYDSILQGGLALGLAKLLDKAHGSGYTGVVTAEDRRGTAAFIGFCRGAALLLARRETGDRGSAGEELSFFTFAAGVAPAHNGGLDV
ncbi:MAG: tRNA lysidine(34) synthetase TilS [Spirochaetaceae bacterium]|nr:tRNA lysidine(34) synthetase TilS [Spirochaetaceae bacterium]